MNKLISAGLSAVLVLTLCSCGARNASGGSAGPPGAQTQEETAAASQEAPGGKTAAPEPASASAQTRKEIKIGIVPPAGWEPVAGSVLPVQYRKDTVSFMVKREDFQSAAMDGVVTEAKQAFEGAFGEVKYAGDTESITVDGNDARKMIFTCMVSGMQMKYEYVYLSAGGSVYAITFGGPPDTFDSLSPDYEKILTDIRFQ